MKTSTNWLSKYNIFLYFKYIFTKYSYFAILRKQIEHVFFFFLFLCHLRLCIFKEKSVLKIHENAPNF